MTHEELKEFILSRMTDKETWAPKIETFFKEHTDVTRESFEEFFEKCRNDNRRSGGSIWSQMIDRARGTVIRLEDIAHAAYEVDSAFDELELIEFQSEMAQSADLFRIKAVEAFNENDRYTCAIYYTLYAIALNKELKDIYIKHFLMERVFTPSLKVSDEISLDESQKKDVVDSIFDRSSYDGFGRCIAPLDFSMVENSNLPFETSSHSISFFDFIGICKKRDIWPDIRKIW